MENLSYTIERLVTNSKKVDNTINIIIQELSRRVSLS